MRPKVAFICVHNSCRSQIAEALGRLYYKDCFESWSAGTEVKDRINPDAVRIMKERFGIDMEASQRPKLLEELPPVDIVITMGCNVQCPALPSRHREDWGLATRPGRATRLSTRDRYDRTQNKDPRRNLRGAGIRPNLQLETVQHLFGHAHPRHAAVHGLFFDHAVRLLLGDAQVFDQKALGAVDDLELLVAWFAGVRSAPCTAKAGCGRTCPTLTICSNSRWFTGLVTISTPGLDRRIGDQRRHLGLAPGARPPRWCCGRGRSPGPGRIRPAGAY